MSGDVFLGYVGPLMALHGAAIRAKWGNAGLFHQYERNSRSELSAEELKQFHADCRAIADELEEGAQPPESPPLADSLARLQSLCAETVKPSLEVLDRWERTRDALPIRLSVDAAWHEYDPWPLVLALWEIAEALRKEAQDNGVILTDPPWLPTGTVSGRDEIAFVIRLGKWCEESRGIVSAGLVEAGTEATRITRPLDRGEAGADDQALFRLLRVFTNGRAKRPSRREWPSTHHRTQVRRAPGAPNRRAQGGRACRIDPRRNSGDEW